MTINKKKCSLAGMFCNGESVSLWKPHFSVKQDYINYITCNDWFTKAFIYQLLNKMLKITCKN